MSSGSRRRPAKRKPSKRPSPAGQKTGRKPLPLNPRVVGKLATLGCSNVEIADILGCDESTIRDRFPEILVKSRAQMREKLRRAQFKAALGGNVTMQIWLGKNMLGQVDQTHVKLGSLDKLSDEELAAIAAGKAPV